MLKQIKKSGGFTLIELLVVVAIIGVLSSTVLASLGDARAGARDAQRVSDMNSIRQALELFYNDNGRYPDQPNDGVSNSGQIIGVGNPIDDALDDYLSEIPIDPRHDAGTGERPTAGAIYFYSYDPRHNLQACGSSDPIIGGQVAYGFNYAETWNDKDRQTCSGGNVNLHQAYYNRVIRR